MWEGGGGAWWTPLAHGLIVFQGHPSNFNVPRDKNHQFWPEMIVSGLLLKFDFTDGFEMINKAWHSIEDVPFLRSSIKFQGHTGCEIDNLNPIWDY